MNAVSPSSWASVDAVDEFKLPSSQSDGAEARWITHRRSDAHCGMRIANSNLIGEAIGRRSIVKKPRLH